MTSDLTPTRLVGLTADRAALQPDIYVEVLLLVKSMQFSRLVRGLVSFSLLAVLAVAAIPQDPWPPLLPFLPH